MTDERDISKNELKAFVAKNIRLKGWTDDMVSILIDKLWRDKITFRTSGFEVPGGSDAVMSFDTVTREFTIYPYNPQVIGFSARFGFYSWSNNAVFHRRFNSETITLPNEEGLFAIYYDKGIDSRLQELTYIKNPSDPELEKLYTEKVIVSFIYWNATAGAVIHFGDDRHGSEWNPQQHWYQHRTNHAQRDSGLQIENLEINQDGSADSHAKYSVSAGNMWHDDFVLPIPAVALNATIPILYFSTANVPRFTEQTGFGIHKGNFRLSFNSNSNSIADADSGKFVMYHQFSTNEHVTVARKTISVMGQAQYSKLAAAFAAIDSELDILYTKLPQQGVCYLGSIILQTDDAYTNSQKARIVGFSGDSNKTHLPVTIADNSKQYISITEDQELSVDLEIGDVRLTFESALI